MWIPHGEGLINLAHATHIFKRRTSRGWSVGAMIGGVHAELACWPTNEQAVEHLAKLQERLNRTRTKG